MEEGKKKIIMIGIIVGCIVAAIAITVATHSSNAEGSATLKKGEATYWVKCRDPKCENTWQMDRKDYFEYMEKHRKGLATPAIECPKCHGETGYHAEKCPKCGNIFELGSSPSGERVCPKCGYNALDEVRKKIRGEAPPPEEKK